MAEWLNASGLSPDWLVLIAGSNPAVAIFHFDTVREIGYRSVLDTELSAMWVQIPPVSLFSSSLNILFITQYSQKATDCSPVLQAL